MPTRPMHLPSLPLPEPLRGSEIPSFTHYSIVVRLPDIARRTLKENEFDSQTRTSIHQLIAEIPFSPIRPLDMPSAPDAARWQEYIRPYVGQNWLDIPWFFAEEYFYQRILEASGYFQTGYGLNVDPYAGQKRLGLETTTGEIEALCKRIAEALSAAPDANTLHQLFLVDLWGNQNDLSMWPANTSTGSEDTAPAMLRETQEHILDNHLDEALQVMLSHKGRAAARIDLLLDNAGFELICDLALADYLLSSHLAEQVLLHIKIQPVFVSDAMEKDILQAIDFLQAHRSGAARAMGGRLQEHLNSQRLVLRPDPFWTSPLPLWQAPQELLTILGQAQMLISKGDANYRRLLGDRHWDMALAFSQVVDYLPMPLLALRTLKSEIAVGISAGAFPTGDENWMSNGRWGLLQFAPGQRQNGEKRRV